jgi:hypothetical protein
VLTLSIWNPIFLNSPNFIFEDGKWKPLETATEEELENYYQLKSYTYKSINLLSLHEKIMSVKINLDIIRELYADQSKTTEYK